MEGQPGHQGRGKRQGSEQQQRPMKRQQVLSGAPNAQNLVPGSIPPAGDVAHLPQVLAGDSGAAPTAVPAEGNGGGNASAAPFALSTSQEANLAAQLMLQQQLAAQLQGAAVVSGTTAGGVSALPQQLLQQPPSARPTLTHLLGVGLATICQAVPPLPIQAGASNTNTIGLLGTAMVAPDFTTPASAAAAAAGVAGQGPGLGNPLMLAALQQHIQQQQLIQQLQLQAPRPAAQDQLLLETAAALGLTAALPGQLPTASLVTPSVQAPLQPQLAVNQAAVAAAAAAAPGLAPAAALAPLMAARAGAAPLMASMQNYQQLLLQQQQQQQQQAQPIATAAPAARVGSSLQRRLLRQLQPSLVAAVGGQLPHTLQQQVLHSAPLGSLPHSSTAVVSQALQLPSQVEASAGYTQLLPPAAQLLPVPGFRSPQQRALQQLQAIGAQVMQQRMQSNMQLHPQTAAGLVQALTAAANQLLQPPALAPAAGYPAAPAAQPNPADGVAAAAAADTSNPAGAAAAAAGGPQAGLIPAVDVPSAVLAALTSRAAEASPAGVAVTPGGLQAAGSCSPFNRVGVLTQLVPPQAGLLRGAGRVAPAAGVGPGGVMAPVLQDGYAALAALATLGTVPGAAGGPAAARAGGVGIGGALGTAGVVGPAGPAAALGRLESVGGQSPVMSEETVESEESEQGRSEGQGSSSSRQLTDTK